MRILIPLLAVALALVLVVSLFVVEDPDRDQTPGRVAAPPATPSDDLAVESTPQPPANAEPAPEAEPDATSTAPVPPAAAPPTVEAPAPTADAPPPGLRVRGVGEQPEVVVGSLEPDSGFKLRAGLNVYGAAIHTIRLTDYFTSVEQDEHYTLMTPIAAGGEAPLAFPYAANAVTVGDQRINLAAATWQVVEKRPGRVAFRLIVEDDAGDAVLELRRTYTLERDSYDLQLAQSLVNRSGAPLAVAFEQNAQGDLMPDDASYLGDRRQFVVAHMRPRSDPARATVYTASGFVGRNAIASGDTVLWPRPAVYENHPDAGLLWFASENRYFAVATHPWVSDAMIAEGPYPLSGVPDLQELFPRVRAVVQDAPSGNAADAAVYFTLASERWVLGPSEAKSLDLGVFAGPRKKRLFKEEPYAAMRFAEMIRYELGCTWCTFQWLANLLLGYLKLLYGISLGVGFYDWGIAIILLVVTVRLLLHPLTKRAQTNMMKMSKQMASLQPEVAKLKKKYKDDQKKQQQEMMKLYREKGINPANALGCLPMFLQMPIWVALYAMLYFAIELRHEPAFYGVFQHVGAVFGVDWPFLADLAVSDRFIPLMEPSEDTILRLPIITLDYSAINILPFLMAIVMYFNMKFTTPPPPENETDEQRMQRKQQQMIMKIMPFIFPILLYSAPSGLTLYIAASTAAGIFDSYIVRKHIREMEASGELFKKKPRKPGGFVDRMQRAMEQKQQKLVEAQRQKSAGGGGKPRKKR